MEIQHRARSRGGEILLLQGETTVGRLTYRREGSGIIVTHTWVENAVRERGLGRRLVEAAIEWSVRENLELGATCPYARKVLDERAAAGPLAPEGSPAGSR